MNWQKSSFSDQTPESSCIEIASVGPARKLRESDWPGEIITTSPSRLRALVLGIKAGEFDHPGH